MFAGRPLTCWPANLKLLDLGRAPYVLYGVKYIDLVSLAVFTRRYYEVATAKRMSQSTTNYNLDLGRAPYVLYGVKYIELVSLELATACQSQTLTPRPFFFFKMACKQNLDLRCVLGPSTLGAKTHLYTPTAVPYYTNTMPL